MICDRRRLSACAKGKVYKTVVRPAMLYGLETVPLTKEQEAELAVAELKTTTTTTTTTNNNNEHFEAIFPTVGGVSLLLP